MNEAEVSVHRDSTSKGKSLKGSEDLFQVQAPKGTEGFVKVKMMI